MADSDRIRTVRAMYQAWQDADREVVERSITDDYTFSSPADVGLDRAGYFERCWPHAGGVRRFDYTRLEEVGDEVLVTYEATREDGSRFRNTEVIGFEGDRIRSTEVYFGWDL